jgi:hypothetical protein
MSQIDCIIGPELPEFCHGAGRTSDSMLSLAFPPRERTDPAVFGHRICEAVAPCLEWGINVDIPPHLPVWEAPSIGPYIPSSLLSLEANLKPLDM